MTLAVDQRPQMSRHACAAHADMHQRGMGTGQDGGARHNDLRHGHPDGRRAHLVQDLIRIEDEPRAGPQVFDCVNSRDEQVRERDGFDELAATLRHDFGPRQSETDTKSPACHKPPCSHNKKLQELTVLIAPSGYLPKITIPRTSASANATPIAPLPKASMYGQSRACIGHPFNSAAHFVHPFRNSNIGAACRETAHADPLLEKLIHRRRRLERLSHATPVGLIARGVTAGRVPAPISLEISRACIAPDLFSREHHLQISFTDRPARQQDGERVSQRVVYVRHLSFKPKQPEGVRFI